MFPFKEFDKCVVTNTYGKPGKYESGKHDGIDIVCQGEDKTVYSVSSGICIRSGVNKYWGEFVVVQMANGKAIVYAHLEQGSRKFKVQQVVNVGMPIGKMGSTGNSSGEHLHIELQTDYYKAGRTENIAEFLDIKNEIGKVTWQDIKDLTVKVDGKKVVVSAVNINGNNFVKLRDLEKLVDVVVDYDGYYPTINKK